MEKLASIEWTCFLRLRTMSICMQHSILLSLCHSSGYLSENIMTICQKIIAVGQILRRRGELNWQAIAAKFIAALGGDHDRGSLKSWNVE